MRAATLKDVLGVDHRERVTLVALWLASNTLDKLITWYSLTAFQGSLIELNPIFKATGSYFIHSITSLILMALVYLLAVRSGYPRLLWVVITMVFYTVIHNLLLVGGVS